jgi:NCAIR mutase (PurE)-related protein
LSESRLDSILADVAAGRLKVEEARELLERDFDDLGFATVDVGRARRTGYPEVIFCQGKTREHIVEIARNLARHHTNILATRASPEVFDAVKADLPDSVYHDLARIIVVRPAEVPKRPGILVVSAGTSDIPVAEEAAVTAEYMGNQVDRMYDVGVAGIHRLLSQTARLRRARVIIAVAGMEGALPSVVAGLTSKPVIAVPTSVGYGAHFNGLAALLAMLNSCASGVTVVNIDNGFGAGYAASLMNSLGDPAEPDETE